MTASVEPPDFDQIARRLIVLIDPDCVEEDEHPVDDLHRQAIANQLAAVVEQVRKVWNARGAADIATLEALEVIPECVSDDAIRRLDR